MFLAQEETARMYDTCSAQKYNVGRICLLFYRWKSTSHSIGMTIDEEKVVENSSNKNVGRICLLFYRWKFVDEK